MSQQKSSACGSSAGPHRAPQLISVPPPVQNGATNEERHPTGNRNIGRVEREGAGNQRIRHAATPSDAANDRCDGAAARNARAKSDGVRSYERRERKQRCGEHDAAGIEHGGALVRKDARLQRVVGDGRGDDRERGAER